MKALKKLYTIAASISLVTLSHAITWTDVDVDGNNGEPDYQYLYSGRGSGSTWRSTFDILGDGFDPLTMSVTSAIVYFAFADDHDHDHEGDYFDIKVGGTKLWSWQEVDGTHYNSPYSYDWYSTSLTSDLIAQLQDGVLEYSVKAKSGDAYLKEAKIVANGDTLKVPDTGVTGVLLGFTLVGLLAIARRYRAQA